jgi:hypothetical protein
MGHKYNENKPFMSISEYVSHEYVEISIREALPPAYDTMPPIEPIKFYPLISLHALI